jgi:hypothetical protein
MSEPSKQLYIQDIPHQVTIYIESEIFTLLAAQTTKNIQQQVRNFTL